MRMREIRSRMGASKAADKSASQRRDHKIESAVRASSRPNHTEQVVAWWQRFVPLTQRETMGARPIDYRQ